MQQNITPPILASAPAQSGNTVDIWEDGDNQNTNLLSFHFIQTNGNQEFVILPLSEPLNPGCTANISMKAAAYSATTLTDIPTLGFYGMNGYPTCPFVNFPSCANASFNVCGSLTGYCMTNQSANGTVGGIPVFFDNSVTITGMVVTGLEMPTLSFSWTNQTGVALDHLLIFGHFDNPNAGNPVTRYFIDDLSVTMDCHPSVDITATLPAQQCINDQVEISLNVCRSGYADEAVPLTLHASETWGGLSLVLPGGNFDQNGDVSLTIPANTGGVPVCTTLTMVAAIASTMPPCTEPSVNVNASVSDPCQELSQTGGNITLYLEDCTQPAPCLCPPGGTSYAIGYAPCSVSYLDEENLPASLNGACLSIEGKLYVNTLSFTLTDCNVILNDDAEIIVENGSKLTLAGTSTVVQGCDHLWNSITVQNGGTLDVKDAYISDGKYAIKAENGASILIQDNTFDQDYIGLYVPSGQSGQVINLQQDIVGNTFECSAPLIEPFNGSANTYSGIYINSTSGFSVGLTGKNYFRNIQNGMLAYGSAFTIKNAEISDLAGNTLVGYVSGQVGVGAMRCPGAIVEKCIMTNVRSGISAVSTNITAKTNLLTGYASSASTLADDYLIWITHNTNRLIDVRTNTVKSPQNGVGIRWANPVLVNSLVFDNKITMFNSTPELGFYLSDCGKLRLKENTIDDPTVGPQYVAGVGMYICNDNVFENNKWYGLNTGVRTTHCDNNYFYQNTISRNLSNQGSPVNGFLAGFSADRYCCNTLKNLQGDGFYFDGLCETTSLRQSQIYQSESGLRLTPTASLGNQTDARNHFVGPFGGGYGANHEAMISSDILKSQFTGHASLIPNFITGLGVNMPDWFSQGPGSSVSDCSDCKPPGFAGENEESRKSSNDNVAATGGFDLGESAFTDAYNWMAQQGLYRRLRINPALADGETLQQTFFSDAEEQPLGRFDAVSAGIGYLLARDSVTRQFIGDQVMQIRDLTVLLDSLTENLPPVNDPAYPAADALKRSVAALLAAAAVQYQSLQDSITLLRESEAALLLADNDSIASTAVYQQNEREVNRIYLVHKLWEEESAPDSTDLATLKSIAGQCPLSGGYAVFRARELYRAFGPGADWDDDDICFGSEERAAKKPKYIAVKPVWTAAPNPASGYVHIGRNVATDAEQTVTVRNLAGTVVASASFAPGSTSLRIDLRGQPEGMLFFTVTAEGQSLYTGKIILQH
ncbi:MAG: right-handed parallel beta-helix repeat-containing protein [Lewinellaceae bacterium]|nr:right-handed parallel beta-helix repeat-containing protein [Lewinellaceae bacterium]